MRRRLKAISLGEYRFGNGTGRCFGVKIWEDSQRRKGRRLAKEYTFKGKIVNITFRFYEHCVGGLDIALFNKSGERINSHRLLVDSTLESPNMAVNEFKRVLETLEH